MAKSFGFMIAAVSALLVLVAPAASAREGGSCPSETDAHGNTGQVNACNVFGQGNGVGNTFNGMPVPVLVPVQAPAQP